jgi:hypothetical protein
MRRLLAALPAVALAIACTTYAQEKAPVQPLFQSYYPLKIGNQWTYRAGKEVWVIRVEREVPVELSRNPTKDPEKAIGYVLKIATGSGEITEQVAVLKDGVYRFSIAGKALKPPLLFFKFDLKTNPEWKVEARSDSGMLAHGKFVGGTDKITLALGGKKVELTTLTITSKDFEIDDQEMSIKYWFAKDYGMVKQHLRIGDKETTLELEDFKERR